MKRAILSLSVVALALAGCAPAAPTDVSYDTPESLLEAYVEAGGECSEQRDIPAELMSEGAHTILCIEGVTMMIVFDSEEQANGYVADVAGNNDSEIVRGDRWVVIGESVEAYAGDLGGRVLE